MTAVNFLEEEEFNYIINLILKDISEERFKIKKENKARLVDEILNDKLEILYKFQYKLKRFRQRKVYGSYTKK